ncbi:hypothetical protein A0J61_02303 [Choanephora cucurbitarum]|uniref:Uncharacterized protein n=1 Tax=Choanephora cucurbitarum TaxID=101091 RepID=A0A1C7NKQ6_9FUNG|nr:hypothetical protein A0J61_02303 [Choanephora cucurbitarum]
MTTSLHKLSLPSSITSTNESETAFSRDLLRQFDKKRSQLHFELGFASQGPSSESSIGMPYSGDEEPIQLDHAIDDEQNDTISNHSIPSHQRSTEPESIRERHLSNESIRERHLSNRPTSSASDLLRRSSAFLKSKFDAFKKHRPEDTPISIAPHQSTPALVSPQPNTRATKVLMKTTIAIPSNHSGSTHHSIPTPIPPTITQYPPKPLVYSPIEPIVQPDETPSDHKRLLHRISMPLMRVYQHHESIPRNKSITTLSNRRRKSEPEDHTKRKIRRGK